MSIQLSAITLGVSDLTRAKNFYTDGLGCTIEQDHPGYVSMKVGDSPVELGLYTWEALAADAGVPAEGSGFRGVMLNYIVERGEGLARIKEVLEKAHGAGGKVLKPAEKAQWGGYSGHFADPDGYIWKVSGY